jgi:hypothetical protein
MGSMTVRIRREVVEFVDIELGLDPGEEELAVAECREQLGSGEISGWDYLTPPEVTFRILHTMESLDIDPVLLRDLSSAGIGTAAELRDLGFDALCQIVDQYLEGCSMSSLFRARARERIKMIFDKLAETA